MTHLPESRDKWAARQIQYDAILTISNTFRSQLPKRTYPQLESKGPGFVRNSAIQLGRPLPREELLARMKAMGGELQARMMDEHHCLLHEEKVREKRRAKRRAMTYAGLKRAVTPIEGEAPMDERLRESVVISPAKKDWNKPRPAVLSEPLPMSVQRLMRKDPKTGQAGLTKREGVALGHWAGDFRCAWSGGISAQKWGERVDGERISSGGRTLDQLVAKDRLRRANAILGTEMIAVVQRVMIDQATLDQGAVAAGFSGDKATMRGGGKLLLIVAARHLSEFYTDEGD